MDFNMAGPAIALGLSLIGSSIGCYISGAASHAAMSRTEEGHGKFIGMSAAPSSQSIYGFLENAAHEQSHPGRHTISSFCYLHWCLCGWCYHDFFHLSR